MVEGVENITNLVARYSTFEAVYLKNQGPGTEQLKTSLVALYASILTYLGKTYHYFAQSTAKRVMKGVLRAADTDTDDPLKDVHAKQQEVDRDAQLVATEVLQSTAVDVGLLSIQTVSMHSQLDLIRSQLDDGRMSKIVNQQFHAIKEALSALTNPVQRVVANTPARTDGLDGSQRRLVLEWLSTARPRHQHSTERHRRLPGSGEWMFASSEFRTWKDSSISGTLWLHGMPGCGKTKLA